MFVNKKHLSLFSKNMTVVLAFNERTKSFFLFREASETNFALVVKNVEENSRNFISASVNRLPKNIEYTLKTIAKFETAFGFLKHKNSNLVNLLQFY